MRTATTRVFTAAIIAGGCWSAMAQPILQVHGDSLTTYLPGASPIQGVRPHWLQRGVHLDGNEREPSPFGWAIAGNPFAEVWNDHNRLEHLRLDTGSYSATEVDLALPCPGFSWVIGRSYSNRQESGDSHIDSAGYQGYNWFQSSQPEIVYYDHPSDAAKDMLVIVYGADRYLEFKRADASSTVFNATNGAAGAIHHQVLAAGGSETGEDLYTYYDQRGAAIQFFGIGDADITDAKEGQMWRITDPAGNVAAIGHATSKSTALSSGFDSTGKIVLAYDSAGRKYEYTYTSGRLTKSK